MTRVVLKNGHTAVVTRIAAAPAGLPAADHYSTFYEAAGLPNLGKGRWILAKGHRQAPGQVVVWYPNGRMYSGFGNTFEAALNDAVEGAWFYI